MGEPSAEKPPARGRSTTGAAPAIRLPASIRRDDVERVCARAATRIARPGSEPAVCDVRDVDRPALPTVDVLVRLALVARRSRRTMRLEHASPAILELLELCGLTEVLQTGDEPGDGPPTGDASGGEDA